MRGPGCRRAAQCALFHVELLSSDSSARMHAPTARSCVPWQSQAPSPVCGGTHYCIMLINGIWRWIEISRCNLLLTLFALAPYMYLLDSSASSLSTSCASCPGPPSWLNMAALNKSPSFGNCLVSLVCICFLFWSGIVDWITCNFRGLTR